MINELQHDWDAVHLKADWKVAENIEGPGLFFWRGGKRVMLAPITGSIIQPKTAEYRGLFENNEVNPSFNPPKNVSGGADE